MSDVLSQIVTFLSSGAGKAVEGGAVAGGGLLQGILANNEAQKKQKFVEDLITNPGKFNQFVAGFQKPLQAGLTADVARQTDAYGAERGLSSSPAIMKDVYAQALAPILQQQQQSAQQAALQSLGIYEQSPTTKPIDVSSILKLLMSGSQPAGSNPTAGIDLNTAPSPSPDISGLLSGPVPLPAPTIGGGAGFDPSTMEGS